MSSLNGAAVAKGRKGSLKGTFDLEAANMSTNDVANVYEATAVQQAMYGLALEEEAGGRGSQAHPWLYSDSYWFALPAKLDVAHFVRVWDLLIERLAILRTSFLPLPRHGRATGLAAVEWKPGIGPQRPLAVQVNDMFPPGRQAGMPRLTSGQVCACAVLILDTGVQPTFRLDLHHALMDGTSVVTLMTVLMEMYRHPQPLSLALDTPHLALAADELRQLNTAADGLFWVSYLSGIQPASWPIRTGTAVSNGLYCTDSSVTAVGSRGDAFPHNELDTSTRVIRAAVATAMAIHAFDPTVADDLEKDIVFIEVVSLRGRLSPQAKTSVGPVLGYRLVRSRPRREMLLDDLQSQLGTNTFGQHEMADLSKLLGSYDGDRHAEFRTSCQVMLVCQSKHSVPELDSALSAVSPMIKRSSHTSAPLAVEVLPLSLERNEVRVRFDSRYIVEADAQAFAAHIVAIINMMTCRETQRPLTVAEVSRKLAERDGVAAWRRQPDLAACLNALSQPGPQTMHGAIEQQALRFPLKIALQYDQLSFVTYGALNRRAALVACNLRNRGVQAGSFVIIAMNRNDATIAVLLGVLKAGAAYIPVDPADPPARKKLIFEETGAVGVVTEGEVDEAGTRSMADWIPHSAGHWTADELEEESTSKGGLHAYLQTDVAPDSLAYLLFTSGSTGRPKAVAVEHRHVSTWNRTNRSLDGLQWRSRFLLLNSLAFDISVAAIIPCLSRGACLCIPSPEALAIEWDSLSESLLVTDTLFTPTILKAAFVHGVCPNSAWLQRLRAGGEALPLSLVETVGRHYDFTNQYGPTETCVTVMASPSPLRNEKRPYVTVGRPFPSVRVLVVLPGTLQPVPYGAIGELVIFGPQTTRGYFGRSDLTLRAFGSDDVSGLRYFRTGDAARLRPDGEVEVRGRIDSQVKIRGLRIELGEVQTALQAIDGVQETIAFVVYPPAQGSEKEWEPYLAAALRFREKRPNGSNAVLDEQYGLCKLNEEHIETIQRHLESRLPHWMVPAAIYALDKVPLMPSSGKADTKTIAARIGALGRGTTSPSPSSNCPKMTANSNADVPVDLLAFCVGAWTQVLGLEKETAERLTGESSFFRQGGDSIKMMQLHKRYRIAGHDVSHVQLRAHPTLAGHVALLSSHRAPSAVRPDKVAPRVSEPASGCIQQARFAFFGGRQRRRLSDFLTAHGLADGDVVDMYPLTPMQVSLVSTSIADPKGGWNWGVYEFDLPSNVDLPRLCSAWRATVATADVLRTVFLDPTVCLDDDAEELRQYQATLSMTGELALNLCDLERAAWPSEGRPILQYGCPAVDLSVERGAKTRLRLCGHHAVLDGWSLRMILVRLSKTYNGMTAPATTATATDSAPFSAAANAIASMTWQERQRAVTFWQDKLDDPPQLDWPRSQRPEDAIRKPRTDSMLHDDLGFLPPPHTFGHAAETTLAAMLRTAVGATLAAHAGSTDVVFAEVSWGRSWLVDKVAEAVDVVGPCLTTLPVRMCNWHEQTWSQAATANQQTFAHAASLPPLSLKEALPTGTVCPIHVLASLQSFNTGNGAQGEDRERSTEDLNLGDVWLDDMPIDFRVVVQATQLRDATWRLGLKYDSAFLNHGDALTFLSHLATAVRFGLANPGHILSETEGVAFASPLDRSRWLSTMNRVPSKRSLAHPTFLERFSRVCQRFPQKIALQFSNRAFVTYAELDARSSVLAIRLCRLLRTCRSDLQEAKTPVIGVLLNKSVIQIVSLLAIQKAGASYLPLDGTQPSARLHYLVETTATRIVLIDGDTYRTKVKEAQLDKVTCDVTHLCAEDSPEEPLPPFTGQELAYVLFTSGSTGRPKAVQVGADQMAAFLTSALSTYPLNLTSRRLGFSKLTFDMSVSDIFATLSSGACLVLATEEALYENLQAQVEEANVTYLNLTPTVASLLDYRDLAMLQCVALGGEPVSTDLLRTLTSMEGLDVFNSMGPTETVVDILALRLSKQVQGEAFVPLGVPLRPGRSRVYLLDAKARLVPSGVPGEICIAGDQVSHGYLDNAAAQVAFCTDPFYPNQRMYRSGDIGRLRSLTGVDPTSPKFVIEHLGRQDQQIKLNGIRIDLSEVEAALKQHKAVANAAVVVNVQANSATCRSPLGSLVAFVTYKQGKGEAPAKDDVLDQAAKFLPSYAVPSWLEELPSIPFTTSGKVDSKRLKSVIVTLEAKMQDHSESTMQHDPPLLVKAKEESVQDDSIRTRLVHAWAKVLGRSSGQIRDSDAFYRIGGDSISAIRLAAESRRVQLPLKLADIASQQTLAQQIKLVQDRVSEGKASRDIPATSAASVPTLLWSHVEATNNVGLGCLGPAQDFFLGQAARRGFDYNHFNQSMTWSVGTEITIGALAAAWSRVMQSNPALRWRFVKKGGKKGIPPHWKVATPSDVTRSEEAMPLSLLEEITVESHSDLQKAMDDYSASHDICKGNVVRAALISGPPSLLKAGRKGNDEEGKAVQRILFVTIHHLCVDLVSWRSIHALLTQTLEEDATPAHNGAGSDNDSASYHLWVNTCRAAPRELQPANGDTHPWPSWKPESIGSVGHERQGAKHTLHREILNREEAQRLIDFANDGYGLQMLDILITMAALSLVQCTEMEGREGASITFGLEGHGRSSLGCQGLDVESTVGWFTSISLITLGVPLDGNLSLLLGRVRSERLKAQRGLLPSLFSRAVGGKDNHEHLPLLLNYHGRFQEMDAKAGSNSLQRFQVPEIRSADHGSSVPDDLFALSSLEIWFSASGNLQVAMSLPRSRPQLHTSMRRFADCLQGCCLDLLNIVGTNGRQTLLPEDCEAGFSPCPSVQDVEQFVENLATTDLRLCEMERCLSCLPMQEGLLAESQLSPSTDAYLTYRSYAIPSEVSIQQLIDGYQVLMERHEILRTVFVYEGFGGGIMQVILTPTSAIDKVLSSRRGKMRIERILADVDNGGGVDLQIRQWLQEQNMVGTSAHQPLHGFALFPTQSGPSRLVWFAHHALIDAWTINALETQWDSLCSLSPASYPAHPLHSFSSLVEHTCTLDTDLSLQFWRENLHGASQTLFPASDPAGAVSVDQQPRRCRVEVQGQVSTNALASHHGILPSTLFYAAYALTLSKQLGQDDVMFGCVLSGRSLDYEGVEEVIGPLITTVPLRCNLGALGGTKHQPTLAFLERVQAQVSCVVQHGHIGLRRLQKEGLLPHNSQQWLRSMATYQSLHFDDACKRNFFNHLDASDGLTHPFDLTAMTRPDGCLTVAVDFDPAVMLQEDVQVVVERLCHVADQMCALQGTPSSSWQRAPLVGDLDWNPAQHQALLDELANQTPLEDFLTRLPLLHEPFFARARQWPSKVALQLQDKRFVTYHQLEQEVLDVAEGIKVAVKEAADASSPANSDFYALPLHFPRSVESVVVILAVLTCGFAYNPIEVEADDARKRFIIGMSEAPIVIASDLDEQRGTLKQLADECNILVCSPASLRRRTALHAGSLPNIHSATLEAFQPLRSASLQDVAMTLFTGGTTGQPKAVEIEHQQACSFIHDALRHYPLPWTSHKLSFASYTFDMHLFDHFATLWCGGLLIIDDLASMLIDLQGVCKSYDASYLDLTPSVAALITPSDLPFLQTVALGGEAISSSLRDRFMHNSGVTLINAFGPTEAPADTVSFAWNKEHSNLPFVPIGKPFGHTRCYLLDGHRRLVPVGIPGELWVGGPQVARGYKGRPELNERIFVPDDIEAGPPGRRLYRSGDLCVLHANGLLQHLGRVDQEVKIHGLKVDLNQIEDVVRAEADVEDVAVEVVDWKQSNDGDVQAVKKLVAFITLKQGRLGRSRAGDGDVKALDEDGQASFFAGPVMRSIRTSVDKELPAAWHPAFWLPMVALPHLVSGKVNRRELRACVESGHLQLSSLSLTRGTSTAGRFNSTPKGPSESAVAHAWATALQVPAESIVREASYYDLGGDSIDAIRVIALLKRAGFVGATVADVLRHDVLSRFALILRRQDGVEKAEPVKASEPFSLLPAGVLDEYLGTSAIPRAAHEDLLPLTPAQLDLLAGSLRTQDGMGSMATLCFRLASAVDPIGLASAWRRLQTDTPILRTVFVLTDSVESGVLQAVLQASDICADFLPPLFGSSRAQTGDLQAIARQHTPVFAFGEQLAHAQLALDKDGDGGPAALILHLHHALYDGFSLATLLRALDERYSAALSGSTGLIFTPPLPGMTAIVRHIGQGDGASHNRYWRKRIDVATLPTPTLSDTYSRPSGATCEASSIHREERVPLQAFISARKVTGATVARFAYAVALAHATRSDSVVFAEVSSGRFGATEPGLDAACGPLMATAATIVALASHDSVDDHLQALQVEKMQDSEHEHIGLSSLNALLAEMNAQIGHTESDGTLRQNEKLRNLFTVQPTARKESPGAPALGLEPLSGTMTMDFETTFEVSISSGSLEILLQYQADAVSASTAQRFVDSFFGILSSILNGRWPHTEPFCQNDVPESPSEEANKLLTPSSSSVGHTERSLQPLSSTQSSVSSKQNRNATMSWPTRTDDADAWKQAAPMDALATWIAALSDDLLACAFTSTVCAHQGIETVDFALVDGAEHWIASISPLQQGQAAEHITCISNHCKAVSAHFSGLQPSVAVCRFSADQAMNVQVGLDELQARKVNVQRLKMILMHSQTQCRLFYLSSNMEGPDADYFARHLIDLLRRCFQGKESSGDDGDAFGFRALSLSQEEKTKLEHWGHLIGPRNPMLTRNSEPLSFLERFKRQVARYPNKIALDAILASGRCYTYSELDHQTDLLASRLRRLLGSCTTNASQDASPIVGLRFPRGPDAVMAILGVIKAHAAYLPIHTDQPKERVEELFHRAKVNLLLTQSSCGTSTIAGVRVVTMASLADINPADGQRWQNQASGLAYILCTSGSTGAPKAIAISHRSLSSYIDSALHTYPMSWRTRRFAAANYAFDVSVSDLFCTLAVGATLCTTDDDGFSDLQDVVHLAMPTFLNLTPTLCELVDLTRLGHLDCVILGGEPLPRHVASMCMIQAAHVFNAVGPSECCVEDMAGRQDPASLARPHVSIGRPLKNVSIAVLNQEGQHAGVGVVGCIYIGGPQVGEGYLTDGDGDMEGTASAAFSDHPLQRHSSRPLGKAFRSGDLGRWHWDGTLEHIGREDRQIKLRGLRIELEDIEHVLLKFGPSGLHFHIDVHSIAGQPQLTVFVGKMLSEGGPLDKQKVQRVMREACQMHLPAYMVPSAIFFLPGLLPQTPNGKTDRRKLAEVIANASEKNVEVAMSFSDSSCREDGDQTQEEALPIASTRFKDDESDQGKDAEIANVWRTLLPLFDGNLHRSFVSLGGNSLTAIKAVAMFKSAGRQVKVSDLLQPVPLKDVALIRKEMYPVTPMDGAGVQTKTGRTSSYKAFSLAVTHWEEDVMAMGLQPSHIEDLYPCLDLQTSVWLAELEETFDPHGDEAARTSYLAPFVYRLPRNVKPDTLRLAWLHVVEARQILRTAFIPTSNDRHPLVQVVLKAGCFEERWSLFDDITSQDERESMIAQFTREQQRQGVEAGEVPRSVALIGSKGIGFAFVLLIHHSLYDQIVLNLLMGDLSSACESLVRDQTLVPSFANSPSIGSYVAFCQQAPPSRLDKARSQYLEACRPASWPCGSPLLQVRNAKYELPLHFDAILGRQDATKVGVARAALSSALLAMQSQMPAAGLTYAEVISGRHQDGFAGLDGLRAPTIVVQPVSVEPMSNALDFMAACASDYLKRLDLASASSFGRPSRKERNLTSLCRVVVSFHDCSNGSPDSAAPRLVPLPLSTDAFHDASKTGFPITVACQVHVDKIVLHFELDDDSIGDKQLEALVGRMKSFCAELAGEEHHQQRGEENGPRAEVAEGEDSFIRLEEAQTATPLPPLADPSAFQLLLEDRFSAFAADILHPGSSGGDLDVNRSLTSLGFDSIGVMRLIALIRKNGHKIRTAGVSKKSSIRSLVSTLVGEVDNQEGSEWVAVHCLQPAKGANNESEWLVAVHDFAGIAAVYEPLMKMISARRSHMGILLISDASAGSQPPSPISLAELARRYLETVKAVVDCGAKVTMLGWSFGGLLSFEMVRLMELEQGGRNALRPFTLLLLDSYMHSRDDYGPGEIESQPKDLPELALRDRNLTLQWHKALRYSQSYCKPHQAITTSTLVLQATLDDVDAHLSAKEMALSTWNALLPINGTEAVNLETSHYRLLNESQLPTIRDAICRFLGDT